MSQQDYYQQGPPPQGYAQGPYPPPQQPMYYQQQPPPPPQQEKSHGCLYGCNESPNPLRPVVFWFMIAFRALPLYLATDTSLPAQQGEPPVSPAELHIESARPPGPPSHARVVRLVVGFVARARHEVPLLPIGLFVTLGSRCVTLAYHGLVSAFLSGWFVDSALGFAAIPCL
ncbi:hypothetical protein PG993_010092 [Apiospora rasikravindrae]|uniref:Uncharacterized protein n=1 Tax=Apiospora rasikravindrae TaxID=990691 RepID=A0ABR1SLA2_9PEZI